LHQQQELPYYFTAMGARFERSLLTSRYFSEIAGVTKVDFKKRLNSAREFSKLHVQMKSEGKLDLKPAENLLGAIYRDLSVDEFLALKTHMGQAKPNGTLTDYMSRTKDLKFNTAAYVTAIAKAASER